MEHFARYEPVVIPKIPNTTKVKKHEDVIIVVPGHPLYNELRFNWDTRFDVHPRLIVQPLNIAGVQETLEYIREKTDKIFSVRGGKHCFEPWSLTRGTLIDMSKMNAINLDVKSNIVTIGAGAVLGDIYKTLSKHGRFVPAGTRPSVGIGGQGLNGGIGYSTRAYGLLTDAIVGYKVVLADGELINVSREENKALFWALRGSGAGNFGIVVEYKIKTYPVSMVTVFTYNYFLDDIGKDAIAWLTNVGIADDDDCKKRKALTCQCVISKDGVKITGQLFGTVEELIDKLMDLPIPETSEIKYITFEEATAYWSAPTKKESAKAKSRFGSVILTDHAIHGLFKSVMKFDDTTARYTIGIQQLRGKARGSLPWKTSLYWINWMLRWSDGPEPEAKLLEKSYMKIIKYMDETAYMGMMDRKVAPPKYTEAYYSKRLHLLYAIKAKYDPEDMFRYPQGLSK